MQKWIIIKKIGKSIYKKKKILLIGVAYKKNVDDTRESPALEFIKIFNKKKCDVAFHDPHVRILKSRKLEKEYFSKKLTKKLIIKEKFIFLVTDHKNINYSMIKKYGKKVIDTRNIFKNGSSNIIKL